MLYSICWCERCCDWVGFRGSGPGTGWWVNQCARHTTTQRTQRTEGGVEVLDPGEGLPQVDAGFLPGVVQGLEPVVRDVEGLRSHGYAVARCGRRVGWG